MAIARIFLESRTGNARRHVACAFDLADGIARAVHHQRGRFDRRQNGPGVDRSIHLFVGVNGRRAGRRTHIAGNGFDVGGIRIPAHPRSGSGDVFERRPSVHDHFQHLVELRLGLAPGVVGSGDPARLRSPGQEGVHALRIGCGEHARHRAAFGSAENVGALDSDRVHHCSNVVGALFEGGHFHRAVGKACAAFVEADEAAKSAEPLEEERPPGYLPVEVEMRHRSRCQHHVDGTFACHLVGDKHVVAAGVFCLG